MKKKARITFLSLLMCFCVCGCSKTNEEGSTKKPSQKIDPEVLKYYENDKYIVGKKLIDRYHMSDRDLPTGVTRLPEVPDVIFENNGGLYATLDNEIVLSHLNTVYIADVNQDGHFDICYGVESKDTASYSNSNYDRIHVYDVYNSAEINIFDTLPGYASDKKSYYFDLDENNVLCIVEGNENMHYIADYNRAARLLKNNTETYFEWFSLDSKILDFGLWAVEDNSRVSPEIILEFTGFVKKDVEFPIEASQISLEKISGGDFDVNVEKFVRSRGRFDFCFEFYDEGDYEFKFTVGVLSNTVKLHYYGSYMQRTTTMYEQDLTNNRWTTYWPQVYFAYECFLIKDNKESLVSYFDIDDTKNIEIKSVEDYDAFKTKVVLLEENEKVTSKCDYGFPNVDFSNSYAVVSAFYKEGCKLSFDISSIYQEGYNFTQVVRGYYSEQDSSDSCCGMIITYLILPKNRRIYTVESGISYTAMGSTYTGAKPIIYFYPEEEMDLNVRYVNEENLITTYPKYNNGWDIHLNKDGTFVTNNNDREYYALYFDERSNYVTSFDEGFYVTKDNAISFLEEKMDYIGYTNREVNEFIMYWLPILENNGQSLVYFEQTEQRNEECPLEFSTNPDTLIRTMIHIKKVDEKVNIPEQKLKHYDRSGFVVTEWGGVEY